MKKTFSFIVTFLLFNILFGQKAEKLWETEPIFEVPESVLLHDSIIYVSNVNGSPLDKNGKGYISKISYSGSIISQHWINGLNAPKGMAIFNQKLFVSDIDRIAVVDLTLDSIIGFIPIPESKFLNDVTVSEHGIVTVSDMMDNAIYVIENDSVNLLLRDEKLTHVNGLFWEKDTLFVGTSDNIYSINTIERPIILKLFIENTGPIDGLERFDDVRFIISDWSGKIQIVSPDMPSFEILNFTDDTYNAADIDFNAASGILFIPTFFGNSVAAYRIE